ncbi:hypothetical protein BX616_003845, partial [Lobosporangium transversale]
AAAVMLPSAVVAAKNATISVLSDNVYFLSETLYPNWGQNPYQTPTLGRNKNGWDSTSGEYSWVYPENGGVAIMSKWPIKQKHQFIFSHGCGWDKLSNKGFVYAVLDYKGTNIHVFGTHTQSDDSQCGQGEAASYRAQAMDAWRRFIDSRNIPKNELVIMAGDFNIDRDTNEFKDLLTRLDVHQPTTYKGHAWTYDPKNNQIARYNDPNHPQQYLDYVFTDKRHLAVRSAIQTSLNIQSPQYHLQGVAYNEYSDHYPVITVIEADLETTP